MQIRCWLYSSATDIQSSFVATLIPSHTFGGRRQHRRQHRRRHRTIPFDEYLLFIVSRRAWHNQTTASVDSFWEHFSAWFFTFDEIWRNQRMRLWSGDNGRSDFRFHFCVYVQSCCLNLDLFFSVSSFVCSSDNDRESANARRKNHTQEDYVVDELE